MPRGPKLNLKEVGTAVLCKYEGVYYEAKIIDILEEDSEDPIYRIHYTGWNKRYDVDIPHSDAPALFLLATTSNVDRAKAHREAVEHAIRHQKQQKKRKLNKVHDDDSDPVLPSKRGRPGKSKRRRGKKNKMKTLQEIKPIKRGRPTKMSKALALKRAEAMRIKEIKDEQNRKKRRTIYSKIGRAPSIDLTPDIPRPPGNDTPSMEEDPIVKMPPRLSELVDFDHVFVLKEQTLSVLPAPVPIAKIFAKYKRFLKTPKGLELKREGEQLDFFENHTVALKKVFDSLLGNHLLYSFERKQLSDIQIGRDPIPPPSPSEPIRRRPRRNEKPPVIQYYSRKATIVKKRDILVDVVPTHMYGLQHLLRFINELPNLLEYFPQLQQHRDTLSSGCANFLDFLELHFDDVFAWDTAYHGASDDFREFLRARRGLARPRRK